MKVGDLVRRLDGGLVRVVLAGTGVVVSLQPAGRPVHPCATVFWFEHKKYYNIAESKLEVISESR